MTKRVSLSREEKSIESIRGWYEDQMEAIYDLRLKISSIPFYSNNKTKINEKFQGLSLGEINDYFNNSEEELEYLFCLDLVSATEAFLKVDYHNRVSRKDKSAIGRIFRAIHKKKGNRVSLEQHIIGSWKEQGDNKPFSDFLGLLNYRHWLAHGRYWRPQFGREYSFDITYEISKKVFQAVSK